MFFFFKFLIYKVKLGPKSPHPSPGAIRRGSSYLYSLALLSIDAVPTGIVFESLRALSGLDKAQERISFFQNNYFVSANFCFQTHQFYIDTVLKMVYHRKCRFIVKIILFGSIRGIQGRENFKIFLTKSPF